MRTYGYYIDVPILKTSHINLRKSYYFIKQLDNVIKIYIISVMTSHDKLYLYCYDHYLNKTSLITTFIKSLNDDIVMKYIQLSSDMRTLCIPDGLYLYFYKVDSMFNEDITLNKQFKLSLVNDHKFLNLGDCLCDNTCSNTQDKIVDKCLLYDTHYVIITKSHLTYDMKICMFDGFGISSLTTTCNISFSQNGIYIIENKNNNIFKIHNIMTKSCDTYNLNKNISITQMSISNDGNMFFLNTQSCIKTNVANKIIAFGISNTKNITQLDFTYEVVSMITNASHNVHMNLCDIATKNMLNIWNQHANNIVCVLFDKFDQNVYTQLQYDLNIFHAKSTYVNGFIYAFIFDLHVVIYNTLTLIPELLMINKLKQSNILQNSSTGTRSINIITSDSNALYEMSNKLYNIFTLTKGIKYDKLLINCNCMKKLYKSSQLNMLDTILTMINNYNSINTFVCEYETHLIGMTDILTITDVFNCVINSVLPAYKQYAETCMMLFAISYINNIYVKTNKYYTVIHNKLEQTQKDMNTNICISSQHMSYLHHVKSIIKTTSNKNLFNWIAKVLFNIEHLDVITP
jgi:hypothetical protein